MWTSKWRAALPANLHKRKKWYKNPKKNLKFVVKFLSWGGACLQTTGMRGSPCLDVFTCNSYLSGLTQKGECGRAYPFDRCWIVHSKELDLSCWRFGLWGQCPWKQAEESYRKVIGILIWSIFQSCLLEDVTGNDTPIMALHGLYSVGR